MTAIWSGRKSPSLPDIQRWVGGEGGALPSAAAAMLLAGLPLLIRHDFFLNDDFRFYFMPIFGEVARLTSLGHLPFVTDRLWQGGAILAEYQAGVLNPVCFALIQVVGRLSDFGTGAALYALAHIGIFAAGVHSLCGRLGVSPRYRFVAALAAPTTQWIYYWGAGNWIPFLVSVAWMPWAWWALLRAYRSKWAAAPAALFAALIFLSGCPFTDFAFALSVGIVGGVVCLEARGLDRRLWRPVFSLGVGVLLAAPALAPILPYLAFTARQPQVGAWRADIAALLGASSPFLLKSWATFPARGLIYLPMTHASWFVAPAILGSTWRDGRRRVVTFSLLLIALAWGGLSLTPGFWMFRYMFRGLAYFQVSLVILAVVRLSDAAAAQRPIRWRAPLVILWLVAPAALAIFHSPLGASLTLAFSLVTLLACLGAQKVSNGRPERIADFATIVHALIFVLVAAAYVIPGGRYPDSSEVYDRRPDPVEPLNRFVIFSAQDVTVEPLFWRTYRPANLSLDVAGASIQGYSPFQIEPYRRALCSDSHFEATACTDIVAKLAAPVQPTNASLLDLARIDEVSIAPHARPRTFAQAHSEWATSALPDGGMRFRRTRPYALPAPVSWVSPGVTIRTLEVAPSRMRFAVRNVSDAPTQVVLARAWYPGWSAELQGKSLSVSALKGIFVTVAVPSGTEGVLEVSYSPAGYRTGLLLAAVGLITLMGYLCLERASSHASVPVRRKRPMAGVNNRFPGD